jgi:hypothetical protein
MTNEKDRSFEVESKMEQADAVKAALVSMLSNRIVRGKQPYHMTIGGYSNGREQGYTFTFHGEGKSTKFTVSENRNSDNIVVYEDKEYIYDTVTFEAYKNRVMFQPYDFTVVAKYILERVGL